MNEKRSPKARRTSRSIQRAASILGVCAGLAGLAGGAIAAPTPSEIAVAEALFREAKALLAEGKYSEACPKLAESQRIDPAGGTLFALGLCYEADGKTASAWVVFTEARGVAERDKRADRVKSANEHLAALEKKLSFLVVTVAKEALGLSGLELRRDDAALGRATVGVAVPVDPGKHRITASAPGYKEISVEVEVGPSSDRKSVEIPALEKLEEVAPPPTATASAPPPPAATASVSAPPPAPTAVPPANPVKDASSDPGSGRRTAGVVLGGVGIASVVVGGVFGLRAKSQHDDAIDRCPASPCSDAEGVALNSSAMTSAIVADVTIGVGVGALGAGLVLWLTAPRAPSPASSSGPRVLAVVPASLPGGAGASVVGAF